MIGFYDLPTATRLLLYGFFAGALYQFLASSMVLDPIWSGTGLPIVEGFLLSLSYSLLTMFLLTRQGVRQLNGQPTAGWTFGLGVGSMLVVLLLYRLVTTTGAGFLTSGFQIPTIIFGLVLATIVPWSMAIIAAWQGWHALQGRRFKPAFKAMFLHTTLLFTLAIGLNYPWFLPLIVALIFVGQKKADEEWFVSGLSPRMKQEWTRLQRTGIATGVRAVAPEEESE